MVLRAVSSASALFLAAIGITVLAGWYFDVARLKSVVDGWATMKANTALSFVLTGTALWCLRDAAAPAHIVRAGRACAALVILLALITLAEYLLNTDFGVDQLFFRDVWNGEPGSYPGRMAPATALCFLLAGSALLGLDQTTARGHRPALGLSLGAGVIGLLAFAGYLYEVESLYAFSTFTTMAVHTTASFVIFAVGTLCARPDKGPLGILAAEGVGSVIARRFLPLAIVLPLLIGWLRLHGERAGFYGPGFGLALFAISVTALFAVLTWVTAVSLNRIDADRSGAMDALLEERARLAGLIGSAMDAVISIDAARRITLFNPAAEAMFGRKAADVTGQPVEVLIPERLRSGHDRQIDGFGQTGVGNRRMGSLGVVTGLRADGTEFPLEASISQIEVKGRKFFTVILRDVTDRRLVEQALSENAERLKLAVRSADVGLWDWDLRTNEVNYSPEWKRQLGFAEDEIADRFEEWESRCHPDDLPAALARVRAYLSNPGSRFESEFRMRHKDGTYRWIHSRAQLFLDPAGKPARMLGGHVDVTQRKLAEESLRESESRLVAAQALARIGNWSLDLATRAGWWSAEMFHLLGFDPDLGVPEYTRYLDHVHPDDRDALKHAHERNIADLKVFDMEYRFVRPDGTLIWVDAHRELVFDQAGNLTGIAGTVQDITERKQAQEALRESVERYRYLFERSPMPMWVYDTETLAILDANEAATRFLGYPREQLLGLTIADLRPAEDVPKLRATIAGLGPGLNASGVWKHRRHDGSLADTEIFSHGFERDGRSARLVLANDVTEKLRAAAELERAHRQLQALSARILELQESERAALARELHDRIGQSLSALSLGLNLSRSQLAPATLPAVALRLEGAQKLLEATIGQVRNVMAELHPPALDDYGLYAALRTYAESLGAGIDLRVSVAGEDFSPRLPAAKEMALFRIAQEALVNTAKHGRAGQATVTLATTPERVTLAIDDDGQGFDPAQSGADLPSWGLSIMRERAEAIGAGLRIESAPGRGTRVVVETTREAA